MILESAGADGSDPFSDVGHSADAREMLATYKLGTLKGKRSGPASSPVENQTSAAAGAAPTVGEEGSGWFGGFVSTVSSFMQ